MVNTRFLTRTRLLEPPPSPLIRSAIFSRRAAMRACTDVTCLPISLLLGVLGLLLALSETQLGFLERAYAGDSTGIVFADFFPVALVQAPLKNLDILVSHAPQLQLL